MYANNFEQIYSFLLFMLTGIIISVIFDIFRISRKIFKTPDIITCIEDTLFWITAGLFTVYSIFAFNNGELRLYIFIGIFVGSILYMIFVSKYFIEINIFIISIIKKIISKIIDFLFIPIKFVFFTIKKFLFKPISFICINLRNFMTKMLKKINNIKILDKKFYKNKGIFKKM